MSACAETAAAALSQSWPDQIFDVLESFAVRLVPYVPDGGHERLIARVNASASMRGIPLTSEEPPSPTPRG